MGEQGARGVKHTRRNFEVGEFSHASASKRAVDLSRPGLPPQADENLLVLHHSFFLGQNIGGVAINQVILDVYIFKNCGTWVDSGSKHIQVCCGHALVLPRLENWHMCGQSVYAQDGCAPGEKGVEVEFLTRITDVGNLMSVPSDSQNPRLAAAPGNTSIPPTSLPRAILFDTDFAPGNVLIPDNSYLQTNLWTTISSLAGLSDLLLNMWCRNFIDYTKQGQPTVKKLKALTNCRDQDCQQHKQCNAFYCPTCKYTNALGFCYTLEGQIRCAADPEDAKCYVNIAPNGPYGARCEVKALQLPNEWTQNPVPQWHPAPQAREPSDRCTAPSIDAPSSVLECSKWREKGYTRCKDMGGCRVSTSCGCIPAQCSCGDFDCIYGKASRRALATSSGVLSDDLSQDLSLRAPNGQVTICHATGSEDNPYVMMTISESTIPKHQQNHARDIIPAPPHGCSACGLNVEPSTCDSTAGCHYQSACGCFKSACICGDSCCQSGLCSGMATGRLKGGEPCELFFPSFRKEDNRNAIMSLRFPAGSDTYRSKFSNASSLFNLPYELKK